MNRETAPKEILPVSEPVLNIQKKINGDYYVSILSLIKNESWKKPEIPIGVMDRETHELIQISDLFHVIDPFTRTAIGSAVLERSLNKPLVDADLITEKQKSLEELRSNLSMKKTLSDLLKEIAQDETFLINNINNFYDVGRGMLFSSMTKNNLYNVYKATNSILNRLMNVTEQIHPKSNYLQALMQNCSDLNKNPVSDYMKEPVFITPKGLRPRHTIKWYTPELVFKPKNLKLFRATIQVLPLAGMFALLYANPTDKNVLMTVAMLEMFGALWLMNGALAAGQAFDNKVFVRPIADMYFNNKTVCNAFESLGRIDELLSFLDYADHLKVPTTLPQVVNSPSHFFEAKDLRNPILTKENPDYVGNDVILNGAKLTFLTGPNSGGKTALSKTILQSQVLAQIGCYIPASEAHIGIAEGIFYQAPQINKLQDEEGRLGVEAKRLRDIFFKTTPKTIDIFDELIEATTREEKLKNSVDVLTRLRRIGGNTVLVTHAHELVEYFQSKGMGRYWQVEFNGDQPTHKIIPGISTESHSEKVFERLGFTAKEMDKYVEGLSH